MPFMVYFFVDPSKSIVSYCFVKFDQNWKLLLQFSFSEENRYEFVSY